MEEKTTNYRMSKALVEEMRKIESRPIWASDNEGVHERVSFDDTIWGFNLAGGSYYNTPLRVTQVKEGSRAEHAGIQVGDFLRCVNGIETSTLTIQEAHDIILASGFEIKLQVTAPDVEETSYFVYQDEVGNDSKTAKETAEVKKPKERKPFNGAKTNEAWSLAWPCSKKRDVMYKESNCFLVPSQYEKTHSRENTPDKIGHKETLLPQ